MKNRLTAILASTASPETLEPAGHRLLLFLGSAMLLKSTSIEDKGYPRVEWL